MSSSHSAAYKCCGRSFDTEAALFEHYRGVKDDSIHPQCLDCGRGLAHEGAPHPPAKCGPCKTTIYGCIRRHFLYEPQHPTCDLCSRGFKDNKEWRKHNRLVHEGRSSRKSDPARRLPNSVIENPDNEVHNAIQDAIQRNHLVHGKQSSYRSNPTPRSPNSVFENFDNEVHDVIQESVAQVQQLSSEPAIPPTPPNSIIDDTGSWTSSSSTLIELQLNAAEAEATEKECPTLSPAASAEAEWVYRLVDDPQDFMPWLDATERFVPFPRPSRSPPSKPFLMNGLAGHMSQMTFQSVFEEDFNIWIPSRDSA